MPSVGAPELMILLFCGSLLWLWLWLAVHTGRGLGGFGHWTTLAWFGYVLFFPVSFAIVWMLRTYACLSVIARGQTNGSEPQEPDPPSDEPSD